MVMKIIYGIWKWLGIRKLGVYRNSCQTHESGLPVPVRANRVLDPRFARPRSGRARVASLYEAKKLWKVNRWKYCWNRTDRIYNFKINGSSELTLRSLEIIYTLPVQPIYFCALRLFKHGVNSQVRRLSTCKINIIIICWGTANISNLSFILL